MALNIGELFGTIGLDDSNWNKKLAGAQGNLKAFGVTGAAIAGAAAVTIGAAMGKGIADSLDLEAGNDKLQAQLGLNEQQAAVSGRATGAVFSQNFGESMEAVQVGVAAVMSSISGMRDASQADVEDMTKRMLTLADTMGVDVSRAAQVAGQMITTGLATDGVQAADLLTKAMQSVPANVREDILDAADEYGPFFANLGISGEKAMGMLVTASEQGMYGIDKTGDALKEFGIRATDMSAASKVAYDAVGMSQEDMTNKLLAGGPTAAAAFQEIVAGVEGIQNPAEQSAAAIALFGTPLEDLSVTEIPAFLQSLTDAGGGLEGVAGASDKAMTDVASNAKTGFEGFKRQAQMAMVDFVQANIMPALSQFAGFLNTTVGPALTQLGSWITTDVLPALRAFGGWFSENQGTIAVIAGIIGALLIPVFIRLTVQAGLTAAANVVAWALMGAGAIKTGAIYVAQSYRMIGSFVATAASMAVNAARVVAGWVLMGAQSLIQAARMAAAWVIAMGPIGWIIAAVIGLVAVILLNWESVKAGTIAVFNAVVSFISSIPGRIMAGLAALGELAGKMGEWVGGMYNSAVTKFGEIVSYVSGIPGKILSGLGDMGSLLLDAGGQILQGFLDGLKAGFEKVKDFVGGIGSWIADNKGPKAYDLALLVPAGGWIMDGLDKGLQSKMGMLEGTLGNVSSTIASGIQPELAVTGSYAGTGASALGPAGSASAAQAAPITMQVYITEADNADATAQRVWAKVQFKMQEAGLRLGK